MRRWYEPKNNRPDIAKDAPKKKGIWRFFEILWREFFPLIRLNLLFLASCLPIVTIPAAMTGLSRVTVTMSQDKNSFVWTDFWRAVKLDLWRSTLAGLIFLVGMILFGFSSWFYYQLGVDNRFFVVLAGLAACLLLCIYMTALYFFPMLAMVELPLKNLLMNSFVLVFANIKGSLAALFFALASLIGGIGMLPYSAPYVFLLQFSLSGLITACLLYPAIAGRVLAQEDEDTAEQGSELPLTSAEIGEFPDFDDIKEDFE